MWTTTSHLKKKKRSTNKLLPTTRNVHSFALCPQMLCVAAARRTSRGSVCCSRESQQRKRTPAAAVARQSPIYANADISLAKLGGSALQMKGAVNQPSSARLFTHRRHDVGGRKGGRTPPSVTSTVPLVTRSAHLRVKTTIITSAYFVLVYFVQVGRQCILFTLSYFILSCLDNCIIILCVSTILFVCVLFCFAAL